MKKQILSLVALAAVIHSGCVLARELRAPMPFRNGFQRFEHYPYICENVENCWDFDVWAGAFHRQTDGAYIKGTEQETLGNLIFGQPTFRLIGTFPPGTGNGGQLALSLAELTPLFNYSENAVMFGLNINRRLDCGTWDVGVRLNMPFRAVTVELDNSNVEAFNQNVVTAGLINNPPFPFFEEVQNNQVTPPTDPVTYVNPNPAPVVDSFAYRLDVLSALPAPAGYAGNFVKYSNNGHVTIDELVVDETAGNGQPTPVNILGSSVTPTIPFSRVNGEVAQYSPLTAPYRLSDEERARFASDINYATLATDVAAQSQLWITPTDFTPTPGQPLENLFISGAATQIRAAVTALLASLPTQQTATQILAAQGITFNSQRLTGAGDLDVDFYGRRNWCDLCGCGGNLYVEGILGLRLPTGKKVKNPGLLLAQPLGNNGHVEIKAGAQVGYQPLDWFAVKADAQFYHVFSRTESVAAAFTGATVRNIGRPVDAKISWSYFLGNIDFTFVQPCAAGCNGFDIGYQPYYKLKDKISFDQLTALDLSGNPQVLDASVLEANTKRAAHRVKTEVFHKNCDWELYAGWLYSVAGKNIQRESDWYLGFGLFF